MKREFVSCRIPVKDPCKPLECPALYDMSRPLEVEVGCGKGKFLTARAAANPDCEFLGIERMMERVRCFDRKAFHLGAKNAHILKLEALYTFHYLLPEHHARRVYVFFPDPWPKRRHHHNRLFGERFLNALWMRLEIGGRLEFATDHEEYFHVVEKCFEGDARFKRVDPMPRPPEVWTEFETHFRQDGLPIYSAAWEALEITEPPKTLAPLEVPDDMLPREGEPVAKEIEVISRSG